jgi:hypothetical protein
VDGPPVARALANVQTAGPGAHRELISTRHFTRIADQHGVDAKTVERDYVLTHVLTALGPLPDTQNMIFKGGTALRMCYFEAYRYSADLDFSVINGRTVTTALTTVRAALDATKELIGFPTLALTEDGKHFEYQGPLGKQRAVKLDLADDERVEDTATRPLLHRYPDQAKAEIAVYTLDEVGASALDVRQLDPCLQVVMRLVGDAVARPALRRGRVHERLDGPLVDSTNRDRPPSSSALRYAFSQGTMWSLIPATM